jgi:RNA polymerase sigma factor (TIGR02999 family)
VKTGTADRIGVKYARAMASGSVTGLLLAWRAGDDEALARLTPLVHQELQRIARRCLRGERLGCSLPPTALVHEAYVRLVDAQQVNWQNRSHFLAMAARLMRRVLVDAARSRSRQKRGGGAMQVALSDGLLTTEQSYDLMTLDHALDALATIDPRRSKVVELRFFAGLDVKETATVLDVSPDTVMRDWKLARAWLRRELQRTESHGV